MNPIISTEPPNSLPAGRATEPPLTKCPICAHPLAPRGKMWNCLRCSFEICLGCSESWDEE
jgi:hypothetical protein